MEEHRSGKTVAYEDSEDFLVSLYVKSGNRSMEERRLGSCGKEPKTER